MSEEIPIKKAMIYLVAVLLLAGGAFYLKAQSGPSNIDGNDVLDTTKIVGGVQIVDLSVKNGNYFPEIIRVKKGIPVKIVVDVNKVRGCLTSIVIPAFSIRKRVVQGDNTIEFTPTKKGEFSFSCIMGMGTGTIIVE